MRLTHCACQGDYYRREPRTWWMKLLWTHGLYRCYACDAMLLLPRSDVEEVQEQFAQAYRRRASRPTALKGS